MPSRVNWGRPIRPTGGDLVAGISVALVLLPQSLAYAQLAGMPPQRGLLAAALPPLAAALIASSPYLQTGPVALTSLLTFGALSTLAEPGSDEYVALGVLLALVIGVARLAIGLGGVGRIAFLMSPPLITGFIPGAALLILASQAPTAFGAGPDGGIIHSAVASVLSPGQWQADALVVSAATIVVILIGARVSRRFPAVILVALAGSALGGLTRYGGDRVGNLDVAFTDPVVDLPWSRLPALVVAGLVIALVGFAESAAIARKLAASDRRPWNPNREFAGQGLANLASAAAGGFPVGGSFNRTALNKAAGAQTRWSGAFAGLAVIAALPVAPLLLESLPLAVLAGIVIASIASFLSPTDLIRLCRDSPPQGVVAVATFGLMLLLAPHVEYAILAGIGLSIVNHLMREMTIDIETTVVGGRLRLRPRGVLWFASARSLEEQVGELLATHPQVDHIDLDLGALGRIDYSGALVLRRFVEDVTAAGVTIAVHDPTPRSRRIVAVVLGDAAPAHSGS